MFKLKKDPPKPAPSPKPDPKVVAQELVGRLRIAKMAEAEAAKAHALAQDIEPGYYGPFGTSVLHVSYANNDRYAYLDFKVPHIAKLIEVKPL
jgi:hypothetical protein